MTDFIEWECPKCQNWVVSESEVWCNGSREEYHHPVGMTRWEEA